MSILYLLSYIKDGRYLWKKERNLQEKINLVIKRQVLKQGQISNKLLLKCHRKYIKVF